jgi:hypothetical protein
MSSLFIETDNVITLPREQYVRHTSDRKLDGPSQNYNYSGRKITASLGNVTVRGEKRRKEQEGSVIVNSLSEHV